MPLSRSSPLRLRPLRGSAQGELSGIPIAVKDLYETAGVRTTAGSLFFKDYVPEQDAVVVSKLKAAGADIIGKTNTHEIALGVTNINPHYGSPRNPWDTSRITGGSSGGSAAAVAAGMCMAALGSDTGGSIRIPASLCGVVGLKPTYGRVSLRGVFPLSWNLDHAGPLTRSVKDAALLLQVMAGYDAEDPASADVPVDDYLQDIEAGVKGWKIALAVGDFVEVSDPEVLAAVREAAHIFDSLGAKVDEVDISWLYEAALANGQMVQADGAAYHRERLEQQSRTLWRGCASDAWKQAGTYHRARMRWRDGSRLKSEDEANDFSVDMTLCFCRPHPSPPCHSRILTTRLTRPRR